MEKYIYEVLENAYIKRTDESGLELFIPTDPANSDYQAYLESLEK